MTFTGDIFWLFMIIVFFIYYWLPQKHRWQFILIANYVYYLYAGIEYTLILLYVTVVAYVFSLLYFKQNKVLKSTAIGVIKLVAVILVLLPLFYFKYFDYFENKICIHLFENLFSENRTFISGILPVGLSFYTFSGLGYVIDVMNGKCDPYENFFHLALGISFFPCIISGPIERQQKLVPQLLKGNGFDRSLASQGIFHIIWGLYMKTVIADNLAVYVNQVFDNVTSYDGFPLFLTSLFFSIEIYCDFAGYSEIAVGVANLLGIRITNNFKNPYFAASLQEFWKRWHISLSTWFRDYVYIPLGGNKHGRIKKDINLIITMLISGVWHGTGWPFIIWGCFHGIFQVLENEVLFTKCRKIPESGVKRFFFANFNFALCSFLWIFFKAHSLTDAFYILAHMFDGVHNLSSYIMGAYAIGLKMSKSMLLVIMMEIFVLIVHDLLSEKFDLNTKLFEKPLFVRVVLNALLLFITIQLSYKGMNVGFIYAGF